MAEATQTLTDLSVLQEACDRNLPLELHYVNTRCSAGSMEPDILVAHTRLIRMEGGEIHVDNAQHIGKEVRLRVDQPVDAFFTHNDTMYTFRTKVKALRKKIDLNQSTRIVGAVLEAPPSLGEGQRREDYRVSVAALDPIPVYIHETDNADPNSCPLNVRRWTGQLFDVSRGGLAVRIEGPTRFFLRVARLCFLTFDLPGHNVNLAFLAECRHMRDIPGHDAGIAGFQFLRWPDMGVMRSQLANIGRFTADVERARRARLVR